MDINRMEISSDPKTQVAFLRGIRSATNQQGTWFAACDIAKRMKTQTGAITQRLGDEDMRSRYTQTARGYRDLTFISEKALYEIIFRSRNAWAEAARAEVIEILSAVMVERVKEVLMIPVNTPPAG